MPFSMASFFTFDNAKTTTIFLSVGEPFYKRRAILKLNVNTNIHQINEITNWIKKLQERCKTV